jgi:hypothetical protein
VFSGAFLAARRVRQDLVMSDLPSPVSFGVEFAALSHNRIRRGAHVHPELGGSRGLHFSEAGHHSVR